MSDTIDSVAAGQVRSIYERWERLEEEKKSLSDDLRDLFAEAKGNGYNSKLLRKSFALHKAKTERPNEVEEDDAVIDLYLSALSAPRVGARPAREIEDRAKARMSESMADHKEFSQELADAGLISPEAAAENAVIADAMLRKFGNGPIDHDPETGEVIEDQTAPPFAASTAPSERAADESSDTNPPGSFNRDMSADDEASSIAAPQGEAILVGTDSETPADRKGHSAPSEAEFGSDVETVAPQSMTSIADARLIQRVRESKTKGIDAGSAGDSARVDRLVKEGVFARDNGRLYLAALRQRATA